MLKIRKVVDNKIRNWCLYILSLLDKTNIYDYLTVQTSEVYWCLMPLAEEKLLQITPGHRVRPFVIFKTEESGCWGYACSSQKKFMKSESKTFYIDRKKYNIAKSSFVNTAKKWYIPYENIQSYFYSLNREDFIALLEKVNMNRNESLNKDIGVGTLLEYKNDYFLVYEIEGIDYLAYPLLNSLKNEDKRYIQAFSYHGNIYYINYLNTMKISNAYLYKPVIQLTKKQKMVMQKRKVGSNLYGNIEKQLEEIISFKYGMGRRFYNSELNEEFIYLI